MTTEQIIAEHLVQKGIALLDQISRDWKSRVSLGTLDIADPGRCLLAQTFGEGDYDDGVSAIIELLDDAGIDYGGRFELVNEHGFMYGYHATSEDIGTLLISGTDLTRAWIKWITISREKAA